MQTNISFIPEGFVCQKSETNHKLNYTKYMNEYEKRKIACTVTEYSIY